MPRDVRNVGRAVVTTSASRKAIVSASDAAISVQAGLKVLSTVSSLRSRQSDVQPLVANLWRNQSLRVASHRSFGRVATGDRGR
jgi:hypothetical protein